MDRRYLQADEVAAALRRGKGVECFLGRCSRDGKPGIRWISLHASGQSIELRVYDSADVGRPDYLDIYEFGPLDPALELGSADETLSFSDLQSCLDALSARFPTATSRFVNEGVIQDEYAEFLSQAQR